jgi:thymidylate kinase
MIVIEGPDCAGKSTLVDHIRKHSKIGLVKPFYPKQNQLSYYIHSPAYYANFYLERYYISELVYPEFKPGRAKMEPWHQYLIEAGLMPFAPVILYVRPTKETILENMKRRGDDYVNLDEVDLMIETYDKVVKRSYLPRFAFDYKKTNSPSEIIDWLDFLENYHEVLQDSSQPLQKFLSTGNGSARPIMFIGDMPSDKSIGNGYIRAFASYTGSSEFFHKCLFNAGYYPEAQMPYFTNWNKCENNDLLNMRALEEELKLVNPCAIVCLGEKIRKKVGQGETIFHPSYIKRFGKELEYGNYIKQLKVIKNQNKSK